MQRTSHILLQSILLAFLSICWGCSGTSSTNSSAGSVAQDASMPFVKGSWISQPLVDSLVHRNFNSVWPSVDNFNGFSTFLDEAGTPRWFATVPDVNSPLTYRDGKWCVDDIPVLEFYVENGDTLVRYFGLAPASNNKSEPGGVRIYQRVPCVENEGSHLAEDWYLSDQCIYRVYYFEGKYDMIDSSGVRSSVELSDDGAIVGNVRWHSYDLNIVNSLPILFLGKNGSYEKFVITGNGSGFSLSEALNAENLEGDGNEILQGAHLYDFVRK